MRNLITATVAVLLSVGGLAYGQSQATNPGPRAQVRLDPKLDLDLANGTVFLYNVVFNFNGAQLVADKAVVTQAATASGQNTEVSLEGNVRLILRKP